MSVGDIATAVSKTALSAAEPVEQEENPMRFFADNVDKWGALEWFNRMVDACEDHDRKRMQAFRCADADEKDMHSLSADTSKMIMCSSAFHLAREHKDEILSALSAQVQDARSDDDEEIYEIGVREGYERAVQEIDMKTGGDGEYRYCTDHDPERHTPGPAEMIQRIVDRFKTLNLIEDAERRGEFWDAPGSAQMQDVAGSVIKLGTYGRAYDRPEERRAYTYEHQPGNIEAYKLGRACSDIHSGGDWIDRGLNLLNSLQRERFGVFELPAAPAKREG